MNTWHSLYSIRPLHSKPFLVSPTFNKQFILNNDSSTVRTGVVLTQRFQDGLHPVSYALNKFNSAEQKDSTYELELYAISLAFPKFQPQLDGMNFTVRNDRNQSGYVTVQAELI